ncbi:helix-turn-helix domain-containing protein, partial [Streptomyces sp. NPDC054796]
DDAASPTELAELLVILDQLTQQATGAVVVRQRSQGNPLGDLAQIFDRTEDRLRKKYEPLAVDRALAARSRPLRTTPREPAPEEPQAPVQRQPRHRLAAALDLMRRASGRRQREIAQRMNVDESYVSRMLSGQREVSWQHVKIICEMCEGNATLMKPLWEVASGVRPSTTEAARYLRTYLQALRYAAGSPSNEKILDLAQHTLTHTELHLALEGPGVPGWPVVAQLTTTLIGLPETARPLWRQAHAEGGTEARTFSVEPFG